MASVYLGKKADKRIAPDSVTALKIKELNGCVKDN